MEDTLIIDPPTELRFCGPFTRPVVTILTLTNPTDRVVLYKIKTTAPKRYCVRPNFGSISPHSNTKVEICLQPFVYDANEKNKHKFMVQSLMLEDDNIDDPSKLWKDAEPHKLQDAKLKCVFEMPAVSGGEGGNGSAQSEMMKESYSKPMAEEKILNLQTSDPTGPLVVEVTQLREELLGLRKENINLKEQVVRLRCSASKPPMDEPYAPMMTAEKQIPIFYIAISIAAAIFGLLLGKYLL